MPQIAIRVSDEEMEFLDRVVARGEFRSRAAAVRAGLEALARETRGRAIAASYRDAYEKNPPEEWFAEMNSELLDERLSGSTGERDGEH